MPSLTPVLPFFRDGTHERIFTGLACGSLPITSESKYLREQFIDGKNLLFYQSKNRDAVSGMIDDLLSNEKKWSEMVANGREIVMKHLTWDHRAEELIKILPPMLKSINYSVF